MTRTFETTTMAAVAAAALVLSAACGKATSPSPVSPSSTTSSASSSGPSSPGAVHVDGKIASINTSARSFVVTATTVVVPAGTAVTSTSGQVEFKDLQVEMEIHVVGTMHDGVVEAQAVQVDDHGGAAAEPQPQPSPGTQPEPGDDNGVVQPEPNDDHGVDPPGSEASEVEFKGTVTMVTGGCPVLALTVAGRAVVSTAATEFKDVACRDIRMGATLEVKGMAAKDGTVTASRLKLDK